MMDYLLNMNFLDGNGVVCIGLLLLFLLVCLILWGWRVCAVFGALFSGFACQIGLNAAMTARRLPPLAANPLTLLITMAALDFICVLTTAPPRRGVLRRALAGLTLLLCIPVFLLSDGSPTHQDKLFAWLLYFDYAVFFFVVYLLAQPAFDKMELCLIGLWLAGVLLSAWLDRSGTITFFLHELFGGLLLGYRYVYKPLARAWRKNRKPTEKTP